MEVIYKVIQENPDYFAWVFALVNALWGVFLYFNKKSHDKALLRIRHNLELDSGKRSKKYEVKLSQFEKYFQMIDDFGKEHQADFQKKFAPHMNEFLGAFLEAGEDNESQNIAITKFSSSINEMMSEGYNEYFRMKSESSGIKLIASDETVELYDEVHRAYKNSFDLSNEFMGKFVELFSTNNQEEINTYSHRLHEVGKEIELKMDALRKSMRQEIEEI
ncbi:MAG: hypothetical protein L3J98_11240 [Gammaproteobacteria bacterium]|nr:hypothetical protein [Gammaproteobacteria bacterium]